MRIDLPVSSKKSCPGAPAPLSRAFPNPGLALILPILVCLCFSALPSLALQGEIVSKTLDNGMQVVVKANSSNASVCFLCMVKTGSLHEDQYLGSGISHYLEHIVSGGSTSLKTEDEYNEIIKKIGGYKNAYTTYGVTAFHITADKKFAAEALGVVSENMRLCSFDEKELFREKDVILKEFVYRTTAPMSKVQQRFMETGFLKSNLRHPIIGYVDLYKKISRSDMVDYYRRRYVPNNMVFVAVGDIDPQETMKTIEEAFKDFPRGSLIPVDLPIEPIREVQSRFVEEFEVKLPMGYVSKVIPYTDFKDFVPLDAGLEILFAKRNSPIRMKMIEDLGLCTTLYGFLQHFTNTRERLLRFIFDSKDAAGLQKTLETLDSEIASALEKGVTKEQIDAFVSRYKAYEVLSNPDSEKEANIIANNMVDFGVPDTFEMYLKEYLKLTPEIVNDALRRHLTPDNRTIFFAAPQGSAAALAGKGAKPAGASSISLKPMGKDSLLLQTDDRLPVVSGSVTLKGVSTDTETIRDTGSLEFMAFLMLKGSKDHAPKVLENWLEDHMVSLDTGSGPMGTTFSFKCLRDDFEEVTRILEDAFSRPLFDENELKLAKERQEASFKRQMAMPDEHHTDFRNSVLYKGKREEAGNAAKNAIIQAITKTGLEKLHGECFRSAEILFSLYGMLTPQEAEAWATRVRKAIPAEDPKKPRVSLEVPMVDQRFENPYSFEQVNVNLNFPAPRTGDADLYVFQAISALLNGGDGMLHRAVRGDNDLAYFARSSYARTPNYGFFRISSQTSLEKKEKLIEVLREVTQRLIEGDVKAEEIQICAEEWYNSIRSTLTEEKLFEVISSYVTSGLPVDFLEVCRRKMKEVTPQDIARASKKYLSEAAVIVSFPDEKVVKTVK